MKRAIALLAPLAFAAAGCGEDGAAENRAEALEAAAEQSTPEAAAVLENAAEQGNMSVDAAMQAAGNAQLPEPAPAAKAPPQRQAKPHAKGDPVPPPKVAPAKSEPAEGDGADHSEHEGH